MKIVSGGSLTTGSNWSLIGAGGGGAQFGLGWDGGTGNAMIEDGLLWIADLDHVIIEWGAAMEETVTAAIPEPASMALLGFGALALLRKKK